MPINQSYLGQLDYEATVTRKFLQNYPADQGHYKPHEKNMELSRLAGHVVELFDWIDISLLQDELDWAVFKHVPLVAESSAQLLELFEAKLKNATATLVGLTDDAAFQTPWTMRTGDNIMFTMPKVAVLRNFVFNHLIHHRAQLGMYYRLLNVPVPASYGPSADSKIGG
jgi:uncharacterized damage-inducible protein DinB